MPNGKILSVSEITRQIKSVLETNFNDIIVQGEISNFKRHSSGHLYFTLKDENASLSAVMWRGRAAHLFFTPQDGMKVLARGSISVYEVRGSYQIDVISLQPLGIGELQVAFEKLKQKLAAEGLFDESHKKPLPEYPERIGIVTSPTGAAIQDMLNIISRRFPGVEIFLYPVKVQGVGAAEEIANAICDFNEYKKSDSRKFGVDVLIVGRGGGSIEDLWAFNEEIVARAIFASKIPVVSAVGHEIDFTIADFVADLRAPTPSAAAELVVPNRFELIENIRNFHYTIKRNLEERVIDGRELIDNILSSYAFNSPKDRMRQYSQRLDEFDRLIRIKIAHKLLLVKQNLKQVTHRIESLDSGLVLKRGYAIVYKDSRLVDSAFKIEHGDDIGIKFKDGTVDATVKE
ncbi:MAG: exodeoxyribonuclease VII large subunit [Bacteroidetes bacterium]|nr:exodeoxyribonuclease VII large subunit [Bacteroidota bacterium]MBU1421580.1 exodeoxyribonuclease VII large subunit [Bacteroidota bacterium]MBU2471030.1 exodeoxyribonuclease VII large subunit [Bacteroidota bacterium]MBU2635586.1 exodeoxyribonuclease VII large subunit [Bacteroidota bacterium]